MKKVIAKSLSVVMILLNVSQIHVFSTG